MTKIKAAALFVGMWMLLTLYILSLSIFIKAYGTETKSLMVYIDIFGEADIELAYIAIGFPFAMFSAVYSMKMVKKEWEYEKKRTAETIA